MLSGNGALSAPRSLLRAAWRPAGSAALHIGRATPEDTREFLSRSAVPPTTSPELRIDGSSTLAISRRGVGSPALWAKDVPRIDTSKAVMSAFEGNLIQAAVNPFEAPAAGDKQAYVESLVLQELVEELAIPREAVVVSAIIGDSLLRPSSEAPRERLASSVIDKGVAIAADALNVDVVDHVVFKVPDELLENSAVLTDALASASDVLERLCTDGRVQSYGFALSGLSSDSMSLAELVEKTLAPLAETRERFSSLQLPIHIGSRLTFPIPSAVKRFQDERNMLIIGDRPLETALSNGKPLLLKTYADKPGEDVALLLKTAFNLAISVEKTYMEKVSPKFAHLSLPTAQDVAWGHILANQHGQFDNLEEWLFVLETQIYPRFEVTVKELSQHEDTKQFSFAYSMALRELFKCFTASVELVDAGRVDSILRAWEASSLISPGSATIEEVAVKAVLSAGADVVLLEEQLAASVSLSSATDQFSPEQLAQLSAVATPFLQVE